MCNNYTHHYVLIHLGVRFIEQYQCRRPCIFAIMMLFQKINGLLNKNE